MTAPVVGDTQLIPDRLPTATPNQSPPAMISPTVLDGEGKIGCFKRSNKREKTRAIQRWCRATVGRGKRHARDWDTEKERYQKTYQRNVVVGVATPTESSSICHCRIFFFLLYRDNIPIIHRSCTGSALELTHPWLVIVAAGVESMIDKIIRYVIGKRFILSSFSHSQFGGRAGQWRRVTLLLHWHLQLHR